ncbi:farnesol dehydrogenase-like [Diprion similis]|uniref:farnesol dehydrogenase-like n=1 Tax=Diprion similis TaxID=362088 RepID=UPI001EF7F2A1|nr:farnesol dehydrogenase-like [Diprion similis]
MDQWIGKVAVVTGASAGIGAAVTEALVKQGLLVVGFARRLEKLETLSASLKGAKGKFYVKQCDLTKDQDLLDALEWVDSEFGGIDVLINNAGVVNATTFLDDDIADFRNMLNVNFVAGAIATQKVVASMQSRKARGHIINLNSIAGHSIPAVPIGMSAESSTKYAVTALTELVRRELAVANANIKITSISPGYVVGTEILAKAEYDPAELEKIKDLPYIEPKDIVNAIIFVLGTPQNVQITELTIRPLNELL